jgi:hypothetical protein
MATVNINNTDNQVTAVNANQGIIVIDNSNQSSINVTQPVTSVVLVNALGPVGPQGPQGPVGPGGGGGDFVTTASFNAFTGSYNTGSFTGSFTGSLFGTASWAFSSSQALTASFLPVGTYQITSSWAISASRAITSSYVTGSVFTLTNPALSASYALTASYALNGGGNIDTSAFATTGSNTFIGDQFITGSVYITGSLNADAQVYEVSFLQRNSPPYPFGDNLIELDQDLITNPNYTRNINTITINSSGLYRVYTQCRIKSTGITGDAELAVFINTNPYRVYYIDQIKSNEVSTYNFSCVANLNTNDFIEFHITSNTEFNLYTFGKINGSVTCSYMTIEKLN